MDNTEIRLRLVEAAAQLPAVRMHSSPAEAAEAAKSIMELWYNAVTLVPEPARPERKTLGLPGKKK